MPKILLVDDMKNFLDLHSSFLRRTTSSIIMAHTGAEAVKVAKTEQPDIIMLDIEMPELNGIEACRLLKSNEVTKNIPVVMVTSLASRRDECFKAGCDDFLAKPLTEDLFLSTIKKFVPMSVRQMKRIPINLEVKTLYGDMENTWRTKDMSEKGMFLVCDEQPPLGAELKVDFQIPSKTAENIVTKGIVVRVVDSDNPNNLVAGIGVELIDLDPKERAAMASFVEDGTD